jgi:hypothetical protein
VAGWLADWMSERESVNLNGYFILLVDSHSVNGFDSQNRPLLREGKKKEGKERRKGILKLTI